MDTVISKAIFSRSWIWQALELKQPLDHDCWEKCGHWKCPVSQRTYDIMWAIKSRGREFKQKLLSWFLKLSAKGLQRMSQHFPSWFWAEAAPSEPSKYITFGLFGSEEKLSTDRVIPVAGDRIETGREEECWGGRDAKETFLAMEQLAFCSHWDWLAQEDPNYCTTAASIITVTGALWAEDVRWSWLMLKRILESLCFFALAANRRLLPAAC